MTIESELKRLAKFSESKPNDQAHLKRLIETLDELFNNDPKIWGGLSEGAQEWYNSAIESMEKGTLIPKLHIDVCAKDIIKEPIKKADRIAKRKIKVKECIIGERYRVNILDEEKILECARVFGTKGVFENELGERFTIDINQDVEEVAEEHLQKVTLIPRSPEEIAKLEAKKENKIVQHIPSVPIKVIRKMDAKEVKADLKRELKIEFKKEALKKEIKEEEHKEVLKNEILKEIKKEIRINPVIEMDIPLPIKPVEEDTPPIMEPIDKKEIIPLKIKPIDNDFKHTMDKVRDEIREITKEPTTILPPIIDPLLVNNIKDKEEIIPSTPETPQAIPINKADPIQPIPNTEPIQKQEETSTSDLVKGLSKNEPDIDKVIIKKGDPKPVKISISNTIRNIMLTENIYDLKLLSNKLFELGYNFNPSTVCTEFSTVRGVIDILRKQGRLKD